MWTVLSSVTVNVCVCVCVYMCVRLPVCCVSLLIALSLSLSLSPPLDQFLMLSSCDSFMRVKVMGTERGRAETRVVVAAEVCGFCVRSVFMSLSGWTSAGEHTEGHQTLWRSTAASDPSARGRGGGLSSVYTFCSVSWTRVGNVFWQNWLS